jgi:hypothetical protein
LEVENKSATPYSSKGTREGPRKAEDYISLPLSPFSLQLIWTLTRAKEESTRQSIAEMITMDAGKVCFVGGNNEKVTTYHSLFGPDLVCSDTTNGCIHLIGGRFGYNSEKQFNNPLFLKRHCNEGRWQQ